MTTRTLPLALSPRPLRALAHRLRTVAVGLLVVLGLLVLSASPADARPRPIIEEPRYLGPTTASLFKGHTATGCVDTYRVYGERPCR